MAFITRLVGPDEKLIGIARLHWIYGVKGLMWLGGSIALGGAINWALRYALGGALMSTAAGGLLTIGNAAFWICLILGLSLFVFYFIMMLATEIGLTNRRVIYKTGLIFVKTEGIDLEEIKGAFVDNEVFGRLLNYGTIKFDSRFVQDMNLPAVADPYRFVKALNDQRSTMKDEGIHLVLEEGMRQTVRNQLEEKLDPADAPPPTPNLADREYKAFESVEPLGMLEDIVQETRETVQAVNEENAAPQQKPQPQANKQKQTAVPFIFKPKDKRAEVVEPPAKPAGDGPTVFVSREELRETVLDEFSQSTTTH